MIEAPIFSTLNSQSDGIRNLTRVEFVLGGTRYRFAINPQEYLQSEPLRANVNQTKGGAWVDNFGAGIQTISIKGHTGFRTVPEFENSTGFRKFKELRDLIRRSYTVTLGGTPPEIVFNNYTDGESWVVICNNFQLLRSVSKPLLYQYVINLTCIRPASVPSAGGKAAMRTQLDTTVGDIGGGK